MVRTRSRSPRWRKSSYDHDPPYISNHWMDREQRRDQRRRAYAANARNQNDDQSPALKSALALLGLVGSLFGELALDVCALLCCVVVALCPWKWPAFKAAWRQANQSDRRAVIAQAAGIGVVDAILAPLWLLVQASHRRADYARFKADHIAFEFGDESLVYPTTPAFPQRARRALKNLYSVQPGQFRWVSPWWYATSFAYLLLVCDLYLALPLLVCKLGWRRRVYEHRVYDADPYTYHAFRIRPKTPPSDIVAAALHVAYAAAVAAWARCANANPWISVTLCVVAPLFLVLVARDVTYAAITKFYPWGRRRYAQQDHDESSARDVIILSTAAQTCADAFYQLSVIVALLLDPLRALYYARLAAAALGRIGVAAKLQYLREAAQQLWSRVWLDYAGGACACVVVATMYRAPQLQHCREIQGRPADPFAAAPPSWAQHCIACARAVAEDGVHVPLVLVLVLAPWRLTTWARDCWRAGSAAQRREITRQQSLIAFIDLLTIVVVLLIAITLIRLPSLIKALRARRQGEALRQTVFRHMRQDFKTEKFKHFEKVNPFDTTEVVPDDGVEYFGQIDPPAPPTRRRARVDVVQQVDDDTSDDTSDDSDDSESDSGAIAARRRTRSTTPTPSHGRSTTRRRGKGSGSKGSSKSKPSESTTASHAKPLAGMVICLTGRMSLPRRTLMQRIKQCGGIVKASMSGQVTHLVVAPGGEGTTKYAGARQLEIPLMTEEALMELLASQ